MSAEIETLQSRSMAMNTRLETREKAEKLLGPAVEEVSLSPAVVTIISEGPIDSSWIKALDELDKRSKTIESKSKATQKAAAMSDVKPLLDDLTNKVPPTGCCSNFFANKPYRLLNEFEISSFLRSRVCGLLTSTLKSSSSSLSFGTNICTRSWSDIIPCLQKRSARHISIQCVGTTSVISLDTSKPSRGYPSSLSIKVMQSALIQIPNEVCF